MERFRNIKILLILLLSLSAFTYPQTKKNIKQFQQCATEKNGKNTELIGFWITETNDLKVEVFEVNGIIYGRLAEFACNHKQKLALKDHKDDKNPDPKLRNRSWLNTIVLFGLKYESIDKWSGGLIYDLTSGKTYSASVTLSKNTIVVRGYWGIEILGKSIVFKRAR